MHSILQLAYWQPCVWVFMTQIWREEFCILYSLHLRVYYRDRRCRRQLMILNGASRGCIYMYIFSKLSQKRWAGNFCTRATSEATQDNCTVFSVKFRVLGRSLPLTWFKNFHKLLPLTVKTLSSHLTKLLSNNSHYIITTSWNTYNWCA